MAVLIRLLLLLCGAARAASDGLSPSVALHSTAEALVAPAIAAKVRIEVVRTGPPLSSAGYADGNLFEYAASDGISPPRAAVVANIVCGVADNGNATPEDAVRIVMLL